MHVEHHELLRAMFDAAIDTARPARVLPPFLPERPKGRLIVIGAGKASAAMARVVEEHYGGEIEGIVITRYGHAVPCRHIEITEAAHPVPDQSGAAAAQAMLEYVSGLNSNDQVIALISGGGSALASLPVSGVSLDDKIQVNRALLRSGAAIDEMNVVRKHLSRIKGGRLAAACAPAKILSLLISDVPGDDPAVIASGPTVADPSSFADARQIVDQYGLILPLSVQSHLTSASDETPKPGDPRLDGVRNRIVAAPQQSLEAAAKTAKDAGFNPIILSDRIEGEARDVAKVMASIAFQIREHQQPGAAPAALISGGETTVTVKGGGRGGRNVEFLLSLAIALDGMPGISAIAGDTDGIDGAGPAAGAVIDKTSLTRARQGGMNAQAMLANNDAMHFFEKLGDCVTIGPTLTNVNDFRAILVA